MGKWESASLKDWPSQLPYPFPIEHFGDSFDPGVCHNEEGDWVILLTRKQFDASSVPFFDTSSLENLTFHRIGFVQPSEKTKHFSESVLESLFQLCDLVGLPRQIEFHDKRSVLCGSIRQISAPGADDTDQVFELVKSRPASSELLIRDAPIHPEVEDLDAREKWFKGRS